MKSLLVVTCACLFLSAGARSFVGKSMDELHVGIWLTTGERSKDSGSNTTTITVERDAIVWEKTSSRDRRMKRPAERKEFKLSSLDKGNLIELIRSNNLLVMNSIELPEDASPNRYFRISVELTLDEKKGEIKISGPRAAVLVKEEKLYQNTLALVKELHRIIRTQDKSVYFEDLILEPIKR